MKYKVVLQVYEKDEIVSEQYHRIYRDSTVKIYKTIFGATIGFFILLIIKGLSKTIGVKNI